MTESGTQPSSQKQIPQTARSVPPSRYALFLAIASLGCLADLVTKRLAFESLGLPGEQPVRWLWTGILGIETSLNTGAVFGLGHGHVLWLAGLSAIALFGVIGWFVWGGVGHDRALTIVLGFITAGILGNLYDRLGMWSPDQTHAVRDWIRISYGEWVWPNFNLADSFLVCSAAWLVWHSFQAPVEPSDSKTTQTASTPANES